MMPTDAEIAWAAGVFEGEGSIVHNFTPRAENKSSGGQMQRRIVIKMTDRDVLERVAEILGGSVHGPRQRKPHYKPIFEWRICNWEGISYALRLMLPWLCERRRTAAQALLNDPPKAIGRPTQTHCKRGHPRIGPDADVYIDAKGVRHCRPCRRERRHADLRSHASARVSKNPARSGSLA